MELLSIFQRWRHTRSWLPWEADVLNFLASTTDDARFGQALRSQIQGVFEVRRSRKGREYESWPAFQGGIQSFASTKFLQIAKLEAVVREDPVSIRVGMGGGMVAKLFVAGDRLPSPHRIALQELQVVEFTVPSPPVLPEPKGWVADLLQAGVVERGETPLSQPERESLIRDLPQLPGDFLEFCELSEGGIAAPESEQFAILGIADLSVCRLSNGTTFVPLVDMREFGGLAVIAQVPGIAFVDGEEVEIYAGSFREALEKLSKEYGAA